MTMNKCIIITAYIRGVIRELVDLDDAYIICADGGYEKAQAEGILPNVLIGDMDSRQGAGEQKDLSKKETVQLPEKTEVIRVPVKKDWSDTALCIQHAVEKGYRQILVVGGLGGREDHAIANMQYLVAMARKGISVMLMDEQNRIMALVDDELHLPAQEGYYLSVFSHSERCEGVSLTGVEYPLEEATLTSDTPLGLSNEITADEAFVKVKNGELLIVLSRD